MKHRLIPAVIGATLVLAACAGDGTDPLEEGAADPDDLISGADAEQAGSPTPLRAFVRAPLNGPSDKFQEGDLGGGASLEFIGTAYRMVSPGGR